MNLKWDKCIIWGTPHCGAAFHCISIVFKVSGLSWLMVVVLIGQLIRCFYWNLTYSENHPQFVVWEEAEKIERWKGRKRREEENEVEKEGKCIYCKHNFYQNLQSCFAIPRTNWRWWRKQGFRKLISEGTTCLSSPLTTGYSRWTPAQELTFNHQKITSTSNHLLFKET